MYPQNLTWGYQIKLGGLVLAAIIIIAAVMCLGGVAVARLRERRGDRTLWAGIRPDVAAARRPGTIDAAGVLDDAEVLAALDADLDRAYARMTGRKPA